MNIRKTRSLYFNSTRKKWKTFALPPAPARAIFPLFSTVLWELPSLFFAMCSLLLSAGCHSHRVLSTRGIHETAGMRGKKWKIHRVLSAHGGGSKSVEMDREKKLIELMGLINDWKSFTYKFSLWWKRWKRCGAEKKHEMRMRYEFCSNEVLEQHSKWIDSFLIISKWGLGVEGWMGRLRIVMMMIEETLMVIQIRVRAGEHRVHAFQLFFFALARFWPFSLSLCRCRVDEQQMKWNQKIILIGNRSRFIERC